MSTMSVTRFHQAISTKCQARRICERPWYRSLLVCGMLLVANSGCGYMVGNAYQAEVRSVHVPIFTTESYRRGIEFQLTEAVQKEILNRTPFRVVKESMADTRLEGRIVEVRKGVLSETRFDDPRELQISLNVEVTWTDLRSGRMIGRRTIPLSPEVVQLSSQTSFAPEVGQSLATAYDKAVRSIAADVLDMMEIPW